MSKARTVINLLEEAKDFDAALKDFLDYAKKISDDYLNKVVLRDASDDEREKKYAFMKSTFTAMPGKKFVRIVNANPHASAWAFVNKETGDIFKPASWNTPAKHSRGNIHKPEDWKKWITPFGPQYLR